MFYTLSFLTREKMVNGHIGSHSHANEFINVTSSNFNQVRSYFRTLAYFPGQTLQNKMRKYLDFRTLGQIFLVHIEPWLSGV